MRARNELRGESRTNDFSGARVSTSMFALLWAGVMASSTPCQEATPAERPSVRTSGAIRSLSGFVENRGQWHPEVRFFARAGGIDATLTREALVFRPRPPEPESGRAWAMPLILRLPTGAVAEAELVGESPSAARHHFLIGSDRTRWASNVPGYAQVVYRGVSPGIDLVVRIETDVTTGQEHFAYDVHVAAGARLEDFELEIEGVTSAGVQGGGALSLTMSDETKIDQRIGASWQTNEATGARESVTAAFRVLSVSPDVTQVGFEVTDRDAARPLVIDPSLVWATYVGGGTDDYVSDVEVGNAGYVYICSTSLMAPTTPGSIQPVHAGEGDVWFGALSADATTLIWATFLGGALKAEVEPRLALAANDEVIIAGLTWSADFPTTEGTIQSAIQGAGTKNDLFVSRLTADGSALVWSTYYGSSGTELNPAVALYPSGDVAIAAEQGAADLPATNGAFDTQYQPKDNLVARLSADGTEVRFHTYFSVSRVLAMEVGADESLYFAGNVSFSSGAGPLPSTPDAFKPTVVGTKSDGFVARLSPDGSSLIYATYIGGDESSDTVWGLAIDESGAAYAAGQTSSDDFPTTPGVLRQAIAGVTDGFVSKLLPLGTGLVWSTYTGSTCCNGTGFDEDIVVDPAGNSITAGFANEFAYLTTPDAYQLNFIGPFPYSDSILAKLDAFGESMIYASWFGASGTDYMTKVALTPDHNPVIALTSYSPGMPITPGAYDATHNGAGDIVVAKFELETLPWEVLGGGKKGLKDVPNLAGGGWLTPGSPARISARGGAPGSGALLFAGFSAWNAPVFGGTFMPSPDIYLPVWLGTQGGFDLVFPWPTVPAGISLYLQMWIADPGAALGWSATNGIKLTSP